MSSVTEPNPESSQHDELVAYLDGELAPEECRIVEERLASDEAYRQQLRELDQAWEALTALPATAVDDGFARTTIELACVAAEEDLSKQNMLSNTENRGRKRWWIAAGVAAAIVSFVMVRALAVHNNNKLLADLPVITQGNALALVRDIDFLRDLSAAGFGKEEAKDDSFSRELGDFTKANSASLGERREWVNSLTPERKSDLADRTHAYTELRQKPEDKERLRQLTISLRDAPDATALATTLVAFGEWLSRLSPGQQEKLRVDFSKLSKDQQIEEVKTLSAQLKEQAENTLSPEDKAALRNEVLALAQEKRADYAARLKPGQADAIAKVDPKNERKVAMVVFLRAAWVDEAVMKRLEDRLSKPAQEHLNKVSRFQREGRRRQMMAWIYDAIQVKPKPNELQKFFENGTTYDQRQKLLEMPLPEMEAALERLYLSTELGIDEPGPLLRELGERGRGPRNGPRNGGPPEGGRRGEGPFRGSPEGPPGDERPRREGSPGERERFSPRPQFGPSGERGPRPDDGPAGPTDERGRRGPPPGQGPPD